VEKNNLQVLGEPQFENEASVSQLPDSGGLTYTFEIEVQPDITLPSLTGIQVKKTEDRCEGRERRAGNEQPARAARPR